MGAPVQRAALYSPPQTDWPTTVAPSTPHAMDPKPEAPFRFTTAHFGDWLADAPPVQAASAIRTPIVTDFIVVFSNYLGCGVAFCCRRMSNAIAPLVTTAVAERGCGWSGCPPLIL